jgi:hypothetical protein
MKVLSCGNLDLRTEDDYMFAGYHVVLSSDSQSSTLVLEDDLAVVSNGASFNVGYGGVVVGRWFSKKYNRYRTKMAVGGKDLDTDCFYTFKNGKFKKVEVDVNFF